MEEKGSISASFARRRQTARIEASLVRALYIPMERGRMEKRILHLAVDDPLGMVTILLKNYHHGSKRVSSAARKLLDQIVQDRSGMKAVLDSLTHPNREVRLAAVDLLKEKRGVHAVTYASFYESTSLLIAMARNRDMPVSDIEALAEMSKESFLDGETLEALQDIASSLDFIKHRYRAANMLKGYLTEMLRMAPDLTRMGVYDEKIDEPLKKAITASKSKEVDETSEIITERKLETSIRTTLDRVGKTIKDSVEARPNTDPSQLQGSDVWVLTRIQEIVESVTSLVLAGRKREALGQINVFLKSDLVEFMEGAKQRIAAKDPSALLTAYTLALVGLRLASWLMPQTAEDIYQRYFRAYESEPSIHIVAWPEVVLKVIR